MPNENIFYVNRGSVPLYNMLGEVADELLYGQNVGVVGTRENDKVFCKTDYGYTGYVNADYLTSGEYEPNYRVKSRFCDVLPQARYLDFPLDTLPFGALARVICEDEKFCEIEYGTKTAFVPSAHLEKIVQKKKASPASIIATAKKYLGTPYRWGGKTMSGIDCSGLCFMAYYLNGVKIYRDARFPFYSDYEVTVENLRPADLLFFKGHVALYLGNDKIIHSNSHDGKVVISPLDYSKLLACASLYELMDNTNC